MSLPYTFASLSGNVPASDLDANFTYLATSPSLTSPTISTPSTADNSTLVASTAYVNNFFTANSPTSYTGFRNRIINGDFRIDQRNAGASQTITAAASAAYTVDRFYATCTGANVTGQRVTGSGVDQYYYQFTGASSVTAIAFGQRIESTNIWDQEGLTVTLGVKLANSLLTTVTWTAYYPTATDNWTSRTSISTGTFTVTSTLTKYSASITLPSNAVSGLEIELSVGAQTSGTWTIAEFQLEPGNAATPFERRPVGIETGLCQRYYAKSYDQSVIPGTTFTPGAAAIILGAGAPTKQYSTIQFPVPMQSSSPTFTVYDGAGTPNRYSAYGGSSWTNGNSLSYVSLANSKATWTSAGGPYYMNFEWTAAAEL